MRSENIFRDVVGYEGIYTVDIFGNVVRKDKNQEMKQRYDQRGYPYVGLSKGGKQKYIKVHRIVATAFIPNPLNKREVNHIDGDKQNNCVWNLEWATSKENKMHSIITGLDHRSIRVRIVETGEVFNSIRECARAVNGDARDLTKCLNGTQKTHNGYHYEYLEQGD